jgi:hypothetical protein
VGPGPLQHRQAAGSVSLSVFPSLTSPHCQIPSLLWPLAGEVFAIEHARWGVHYTVVTSDCRGHRVQIFSSTYVFAVCLWSCSQVNGFSLQSKDFL